MEIIKYPNRDAWEAIIHRPVQDMAEIDAKVAPIIEAVKKEGDPALIRYSKLFDKADLQDFIVGKDEINSAVQSVDEDLKKAIDVAVGNIQSFHQAQLIEEEVVQTSPGVCCWRKNVAIEKVGLYIPGGTAPLFSTVLMLAIPAHIAGCREIVLCTPPNAEGNIHPAILYSANQLGLQKIYKVGGAQAIAAMAYGTETIPKVYKIFGPGNQYVTAAKMRVNLEGTAIDMPAGPSEVVVLASGSANPDFIASDLLSQAEHGPDSQAILITDTPDMIDNVEAAVALQLENLPRKEMTKLALAHSKLILLDNLNEGMDLVNAYAPEHLIIVTDTPEEDAQKVINAGSVFIGPYSPESAGDYASGTNHVLATNGFAQAFSGVSVDSFLKKITFQKISPEGLSRIGPAIERMAEAEELEAHKQAVRFRLDKWKKKINGS
jgi:histidinol dehydrogenase